MEQTNLGYNAIADREKDIKYRKRLAEMMGEASKIDANKIAGGLVVPVSPLEGLIKGLAKGVETYQSNKIEDMQGQIDNEKATAYADALSKIGVDRDLAMQDPKLAYDIYNDQQDRFNKLELQRLKGMSAGSGIQVDSETGEITFEQNNYKMTPRDQAAFYKELPKQQSAESALSQLEQIKDLMGKERYTGYEAPLLTAANRIPLVGNLIDNEKAANTTAMDNNLKALAYSQLQSTFPGAISNAERESLEKLQAISTYSPEEQILILAENEKTLNRLNSRYQGNLEGIASGKLIENAKNGIIGNQQKSPNQQSSKVKIQRPDGKIGLVDANRVDDLVKRGAKVIE